jgi:hypothetical protein
MSEKISKGMNKEGCKHDGITYRGIHLIGEDAVANYVNKIYVFLWTCDYCQDVIVRQVERDMEGVEKC